MESWKAVFTEKCWDFDNMCFLKRKVKDIFTIFLTFVENAIPKKFSPEYKTYNFFFPPSQLFNK